MCAERAAYVCVCVIHTHGRCYDRFKLMKMMNRSVAVQHAKLSTFTHSIFLEDDVCEMEMNRKQKHAEKNQLIHPHSVSTTHVMRICLRCWLADDSVEMNARCRGFRRLQ